MVSLESLELRDISVDENAVLATFKVACDKAGLDAKVPEFLVKTVGCRSLKTWRRLRMMPSMTTKRSRWQMSAYALLCRPFAGECFSMARAMQ